MDNLLAQRVKIANTDLEIPYATVGTMMFGGRADATESERIVDMALERGLNFFDTADMYEDGESERILGHALRGRRDRCVVATKVGYGKSAAGEEEGLSRGAILEAIDASLSRMEFDHVDIYYLHRPDYEAPLEETLETMNDVIKSGRARYLGLSNFAAWQSMEAIMICERHGWAKPVIAQMIYNPLIRQIEYEFVSFARKYEQHLTVYNPLAGGLLTGKYASLDDEARGGRFVNNENYRKRYWSERQFGAMTRLKAIADDEGMSLTHLTLAWIAQKAPVDSVLLGPSRLEQLVDCLAAGDRRISEKGLGRIDAFLAEFEGTNASYAR